MSLSKELSKGLYTENPVFRLMLGLCPVLAVSNSVNNAIGMGVAATFVLLCSNIVISLIRNFVPSKIRIPIFIMIIATFVTIVKLVMAAFFPALSKSLGLFISGFSFMLFAIFKHTCFYLEATHIFDVIVGTDR